MERINLILENLTPEKLDVRKVVWKILQDQGTSQIIASTNHSRYTSTRIYEGEV